MAIDIFSILSQLDKRSSSFINVSDEGEQKETATFVRFPALRWMSAAQGRKEHEALLLRVNEANLRWWTASRNVRLQADLLATAGTGSPVRHKWVAPNKTPNDDPIFNFVRLLHPNASDLECGLYLTLNSDDTLVSIAQRTGRYEGADLTAFKKALKAWRTKQPSNADTV